MSVSFRSRPVGWRYESVRHSLSAKGVRTRYDSRKYLMPFTKDSTIPAIEYPNDFKYNVKVEKKLMSPDEIIAMFDKDNPGFSEKYGRHSKEYIARLVESHKRGDSLEAPVIYFERENGKWVVPGSGMHDHFEVVLAAKAAGEKEVPMVLVYRRPQDKKGRYIFSDSEKAGFEKQEEVMSKAPIYTEQHDNVIRLKHDVSGVDREEEKYLDDSNIHESVMIDTVPKEYAKQSGSEWAWERRRREREEKGSGYSARKGMKNAIVYKDAPEGAAYEKVGVDSKGRTVRLYSKEYRERMAKRKFERVRRLGEKYDGIVRRVEKDMGSPDVVRRENARAAYIVLKTGLRPGSARDTKGDVRAFGVTTLRKDHVVVRGNVVSFDFVGKKGVHVKKRVVDKRLAGVVREQRKVPGGELLPNATDRSVLGYVRKFGRFNTKDFRTLRANRVAGDLRRRGVGEKGVFEGVARDLSNTPGVSKSSYVDPGLL